MGCGHKAGLSTIYHVMVGHHVPKAWDYEGSRIDERRSLT